MIKERRKICHRWYASAKMKRTIKRIFDRIQKIKVLVSSSKVRCFTKHAWRISNFDSGAKVAKEWKRIYRRWYTWQKWKKWQKVTIAEYLKACKVLGSSSESIALRSTVEKLAISTRDPKWSWAKLWSRDQSGGGQGFWLGHWSRASRSNVEEDLRQSSEEGIGVTE